VSGYVTVGDLRAKLAEFADLPDDAPVLRIDHHDDGHTLSKVHVDIVKESQDGGHFETWYTPEEFAQLCGADGNLLPGGPYTEDDRPPADGVRALTLWP